MQYDNFVMKVLSTANTIGKILLTSGAETYRVEKAISTICRRFDLKAETFVTMTCVLTSAKKKDGATITEVNRIFPIVLAVESTFIIKASFCIVFLIIQTFLKLHQYILHYLY